MSMHNAAATPYCAYLFSLALAQDAAKYPER